LAKKLNVALQITFLGYKSTREIRSLYSTSELTVVTSQHEQYGYAVLDPMALGCSVIASAWNGLSDYVHSQNIFYSVDTLAERIGNHFAKSDVEKQFELDAAKALIETQFSEPVISNQLETIIL
jgi:glycosyltransferase involved in cell wall biosynthesis